MPESWDAHLPYIKWPTSTHNQSFIAKHPHVSGPTQFKLGLFKGQLQCEMSPLQAAGIDSVEFYNFLPCLFTAVLPRSDFGPNFLAHPSYLYALSKALNLVFMQQLSFYTQFPSVYVIFNYQHN